MHQVPVHAMAHITGGGISENLPRVLPDSLGATINLRSWEQPAIFTWLQENGNISQTEMLTTFNCGIGMIVCVAAEDEARTMTILSEMGETVFALGEISASTAPQQVSYL